VKPLPESGALADVALPRILLELYASRFTGGLELARGRSLKSFLFQDGAPVGSDSNLPAERLGVVLQDAGVLTAEQRKQVESHASKKGCKQAAAVLALGLAEPTQVFAGLREQVRRRMVECFGWGTGDFSLHPSAERRQDIQPLRVDPYQLIQSGLQTHWRLEQMLQELAASMNRYASPGPRLGSIARRLELDATVERMIASLNGTRTLGAVVAAASSSPAALAAFWILDVAGALEYSDTPRSADGEAALADIEIEITGAASAAAPAAAPAAVAARQKPDRDDPEVEKMRREILEKLERLDDLDFYELLGVAPDAPHAAVRKAYFLAAKRYHPDAIARLGLQDVRKQAGDVFSRIAEANEVLCDPSRRKAYDESLAGGGGQVDVRVLAQAETFYRKGEILIKMGDFRGALEYLQNAVQLYPDEAVYQSDLGWAYYKKSPSEPERGVEHVRRALELDPSNSVARFRLGVIERASAA